MLKTHLVVLLLLAMVGMVACGGGTSGLISNDLSPDTSYMGIKAGDFLAVRANDAGYRDSSLNRTLDIQSKSLGDMTEVTISISDMDPMYGVTLELNYDPLKYNPENVEFSGLINTPVEAAFTSVNGLVGIGQVDVNGPAVRNGEFAVVTFANEPSTVNKAVSAVHTTAMETDYAPSQLTVDGAMGWHISQADNSSPVVYTARATWAVGDGNGDGESGVADLTPIVQLGYFNGDFISDDNFYPGAADYDGNGGVTVSDITPLGVHFGEFTTGIDILVSDTDPPTDVFATLDWTDDSVGLTRELPPATTTNWDNIFRTWNGEISVADLTTIDTAGNGDRMVYVAARLVGPENTGDPTSTFTANLGPPPPEDYIIDGFTIEINSTEYGDGDMASLVANSQATIDITGISGTFEGSPITGSEANYADTLADIASRVNWSATTTGDANLQYTAECLVLSDTSGAPITGDVFPDDDVETDPEGMLTASLSAVGTYIPADVQYSIDIDVTADDTAPEVSDITSTEGMVGDNYAIGFSSDTIFEYYFDFGTGGAPGDLSSVGLTLYNLTDHQEATVPFEYNEPPSAPGQYSIVDNPMDGYILRVILGAGNAQAGKLYTFRIEDSGVYNSVNKPGAWLTLGEEPLPVTFMTLPTTDNIGPSVDNLWIFWPEPKMRRIPRAQYNIAEHKIQPYNNDTVAFNHIIKSTGDEFWFETGAKLFPYVVIEEDTDPTSIGLNDPSPPAQGGIAWYACPGWIAVNIAVITPEGTPTDPVRHFGYRVFSASGPRGGGTFDVQPMSLGSTPATGVDFGINIFGPSHDLDLDTRDYSGKVLTADTAAGSAPDVIFAEFGGGRYWEFSEDPIHSPPTQTVIRFASMGGGNDYDLPWWDPCAVLDNGNLIMSHGFSIGDFHNAGVPGWLGQLEGEGAQYEIKLMNPAGTTEEYTFPGQLTIVGTNPNDL